jgi:hypothetical protein
MKIDSTAGVKAPYLLTGNLKVVDSTDPDHAYGICPQVDIWDTATNVPTGQTSTSIIASTYVHTKTARSAGGANILAQIESTVSGYTVGCVGAEIDLNNYSDMVNCGAALHLLNNGTRDIRSGVLMSGGGNSSGTGGTFEHAILVKSDQYFAPATNLIYYGPLASSNTPTGTPLFIVDNKGDVLMNGYVEFAESSSAPAAPPTGHVRLYARTMEPASQPCTRYSTQAQRSCLRLTRNARRRGTATWSRHHRRLT